jgi:hypothetical protein
MAAVLNGHLRFRFCETRILGHFHVHMQELLACFRCEPACWTVFMTGENEEISYRATEISGPFVATNT